MTDRQPTDDELLLEALEASRAGNGAAAAAEARLSHDRALQAELEGLKAVQKLLGDDAAWGQASGADAPPPHLLDAILRAEVLARPDAIRGAVVSADAPPTSATSLWSRFSAWLLGGGVLVGTAAAVLLTVSRSPAELVPATADAVAPQGAVAQMVPPAAPPEPAMPAEAPVDVALEKSVATGSSGGGGAPRQEQVLEDAKEKAKGASMNAAATRRLATADPDEDADRGGLLDASIGGTIGDSVYGGAAGPGRSVGKDDAAKAKENSRALEESDGFDRLAAADDEAPAPAPMAEPVASPPPPPDAAPKAPAPATSAPPASKPALRVVSAREAQQEFFRARDKAEAKAEAEAKSAGSKASKKTASEARKDADSAREQLARSQRLQEANGILVAAERELQFSRFAAALDLAQRAEGLAGGGLGYAPASTQTRAYLGLKRLADAVRVASRLLQASPADAQLVDGMIAGADAALGIGDFRLAERLLQRAASTDNPDVARRTVAKQKLQALAGKAAAAPAKAKAEPATMSSSADE